MRKFDGVNSLLILRSLPCQNEFLYLHLCFIETEFSDVVKDSLVHFIKSNLFVFGKFRFAASWAYVSLRRLKWQLITLMDFLRAFNFWDGCWATVMERELPFSKMVTA